ncbi:MAG: class I SAM-dependent methyltransferase [Legionellales bacterium]|nr:class I SAM-dependent methyltransferase [Legionellales bacterium]
MASGYVLNHCPACLLATQQSDFTVMDGYQLMKCQQCEQVYVKNIPSTEKLTTFYNTVYTDEGNLSFKWRRILRYKLLAMWYKHICKARPMHMLEIGCNRGELLKAVANDKSIIAEGIDYSEACVNFARTQGGLNAQVMDVMNMTFPDSRFDFIVAYHVIEHVQNLETTLHEIKRVLKTGGKFYLVMPCVSHPKAKRQGLSWKYFSPPGHLWYFTPTSLTQFLTRQGFKVEFCSSFNHRAHVRALATKL